MSEFLQLSMSGLAVGGVYALVAISFVLIYKATGLFNFAIGNFVAMGAFICWSAAVTFNLPMPVSILIGLLGGAIIGFLSDRFAFRPLIGQPILSTMIMTLALSSFLAGITVLLWGGLARSYPNYMPSGVIRLGDVTIGQDLTICFIVAMILLGIFAIFFQRTKAGLAMRATAENHQVAQAAGIRVKNIFTLIWVISGLVCAIGGILIGTISQIDLMLSDYALKVIPAVIIGGLESIPGAVVGGLAIGLLEKWASGYLNPLVGGGIQTVFAYIIMIIVLVIRPYGVFGLERIERI